MDDTAKSELCIGLRRLADFLEEHPDFPLPYLSGEQAVAVAWTKEQARDLVLQLGGKVSKKPYFGYMRYSKELSPRLSLVVQVSQDKVCVKKVVGTEEVPEQVIPARTKELVEWECSDPLLAPSKEEANV